MFISETHLPQLLPPGAYCDQAWYDRELEDVLLPAWHLVASYGQFPREGSFVTLDLFGRPIILRRHDGEIRGFLNVCAHRFTKLTDQSLGCAATLKCCYHGWEYDECSGATRKIPDAPSFRPLEPGLLGLTPVRVAVYGGLVFVSLAREGPPPFDGVLDREFASLANRNPAGGQIGARVEVCPANWKIAVENSLESYHVAEVHSHTFTSAPHEEDCEHTLFETGSTFTAPGCPAGFVRRLQSAVLKGAGLPLSDRYRHIHLHPTLTAGEVDSFMIFLSFLPEGPLQTRARIFWFVPQNDTASGIRNALVRQAGRLESRFWLRVWGEDLQLLPKVQKGALSVEHPGSGLISRREERIPHFQRWLLTQLGISENQSELGQLGESTERVV